MVADKARNNEPGKIRRYRRDDTARLCLNFSALLPLPAVNDDGRHLRQQDHNPYPYRRKRRQRSNHPEDVFRDVVQVNRKQQRNRHHQYGDPRNTTRRDILAKIFGALPAPPYHAAYDYAKHIAVDGEAGGQYHKVQNALAAR